MTSHADAAFRSIADGDQDVSGDPGVYYQRAQALALLAIWSTLDEIAYLLEPRRRD